jgi:hypothetical protein
MQFITDIFIFIQALTVFLNKATHTEIADRAITEDQQEVLRDICEFLQIPHAVQELLSAEHTPTLCEVLPQYENLLVMLRDLRVIKLREAKPQLSRAINAAIKKIEEYVQKSRKTRIYALAMSKWLFLTLAHLTDNLNHFHQ